MKSFSFVLFFLSSSLFTFGQSSDRFTEEDMAMQKSFIEAHQQKLLGRYDRALPLYENVYKSNRSNPVVSFELARVHMELQDIQSSEKFIKKAIALDASNKWYHEFLAHLLTDEKRYLEAAKAYDKLVQLQPSNHSYYHDLAASYLNHGAFADAITSLNRLESKIGIAEEVSRKKFELYDTLGEEKKAIRELESLINFYPRNVKYQNNLASYYLQKGNDKKAQKIYQNVLKIDPDDPTASLAVNTKVAIGSAQSKLLLQLHPVIRNEDISVDDKIKRLMPYLDDEPFSSDEDLALLLTELTKTHPTEAKAHAILGDYYALQGKYLEAAKSYEKTLELNKNIYAVWSQYMFVLDANQNWDELSRTSEKATDFFPNQAEPYYFKGKVELQRAGIDQNEAFMRGLKLDDRQKMISNAISLLSEASFIAGKNLELKYKVYTYLAKAYVLKKDSTKAQSYVSKALEINPKGNPVLEEVQSAIEKL